MALRVCSDAYTRCAVDAYRAALPPPSQALIFTSAPGDDNGAAELDFSETATSSRSLHDLQLRSP
jgi:hypothetical protein